MVNEGSSPCGGPTKPSANPSTPMAKKHAPMMAANLDSVITSPSFAAETGAAARTFRPIEFGEIWLSPSAHERRKNLAELLDSHLLSLTIPAQACPSVKRVPRG